MDNDMNVKTDAAVAAGGTAALARFAATLRYEQIPPPVIERAKELMLDWFASSLAGKHSHAIQAIEGFALQMGPASGESEILVSRRMTSPYFAAMINGAASHVAEQDDVHNGSVFHPGAVVFSAALAVAQAYRSSGTRFLTAVVAGYETGIRIGEFLGRSHYKVFHTTGTAGTLAAAVAVGSLLELTPAKMLDALGSAGTQAAGLWEFLRDAADSKQLHVAKAASDGLLAAFLARDGFTGAKRILEGDQGMAAGMSRDADPARLTHGLGTRWALAETSFKYHACCRHAHPAADALLDVMRRDGIKAGDIRQITAHVHQAALDVLDHREPRTVHQAKFSMCTILALIALRGRAGMAEFADHFAADDVSRLRARIAMAFDAQIDRAYPERWIGKVSVETNDGQLHTGRVDEPKGDPGNTLSLQELRDKALRLAEYSGAASGAEMDRAMGRIMHIEDCPAIGRFLVE
jgi:2-methylcitrate dehydratase PrpD